jgi:hypothetical protein
VSTFLDTGNHIFQIYNSFIVSQYKVLNKIIHTDQKGFVAGRNISENNRMIDDIIEFVDNEDEEGVIIFVDQQKAFDRMEWGWLNYVMECFNFGLKFRDMLFKKGKTCIKTNGFISNFSQYRIQPDKDVLLHRFCTLFRQSRWLVLSETLQKYMVSNYLRAGCLLKFRKN